MDVGQRHWAIQRLDVHMGIADVAYIHVGGSALQNYIATKLFSMQRTGSGLQGRAGGDRDQVFVIRASGIGGGAGEKVRNNIHAIPALAMVNLNFAGMKDRRHRDLVAGGRLDGNGAVPVGDGNAGSGTDRETIFFPGLGYSESCRGEDHHYRQFCATLPLHAPSPQRPTFDLIPAKVPLPYIMAENGPKPDRKSTRLNSSHGYISYAVFCLKKKK